MNISTLSAGTVKALATPYRGASETAFQSLLVASVQALRDVREHVHEAEEAALSLAQQQKLVDVETALDTTTEALQSGLSAQGRCLMNDRPTLREAVRSMRAKVQASLSPARPARPWTDALDDALLSLDEAADHVADLALAQPVGSPARFLGRRVAGFLRLQHSQLRREAERLHLPFRLAA